MLTDSHKASRAPQRVRNELRFRQLTVTAKTKVADIFWRIEFSGEDLAGFTSPGFDDHIKVFFPDATSGTLNLPEVTEDGVVWKEGARPVSRDYTPLFFDGAAKTLTLDFYIHDGGVASDWATRAQPGDALAIGGPRGSLVVPEDYAWQLYVCDESGMPALRRRLEGLAALPSRPQVTAIVSVNDIALQDYLAHLDGFTIEWIVGHDEQTLAARLAQLNVPAQDYFIWLTGEGETVKKLATVFEGKDRDPQLLRTVAYWHKKG